MANTAPALIWMSGTDKRFTFFNKAWLDLTGRTLDQELDNGWIEGLHSEDAHSFLAQYRRSFEARKEFSIEHRWAGIMGFTERGLPEVKMVGERIALGFGCNGMGVALSADIAAETALLLTQ